MSTDVSNAVLDEAASRGETLTIHDLLRLIERFDTGPGITEQRLDSYITVLGKSKFNEDALRDGLDTRLVDADEWQTETEVYHLDGGVSAFPPRWHEDLAGEDDLTRYVATMTAAVDGGSEEYAHGGHGDGVPEKLLLDTAVIFSDYTYGEAMDEVDRLREEDLLTADADQHPNARIQLTPTGAAQLGIDPEADDVGVKTGTNRTKDPRIDE
jgi:hypothetical protein